MKYQRIINVLAVESLGKANHPNLGQSLSNFENAHKIATWVTCVIESAFIAGVCR